MQLNVAQELSVATTAPEAAAAAVVIVGDDVVGICIHIVDI